MSVSVNQQGVLAGKVAVITGASRGIGDALARRYAMEGAKVVVFGTHRGRRRSLSAGVD